MNLYSRIQELCKLTGDTMYSLAKNSGVSESALSRLKSNSQVKMNKKNLILLANYFCVNETWLATGDGDKSAPGIVKDTQIHDCALHERYIKVAHALFGSSDKNDIFNSADVNVEAMSLYTGIESDRVRTIIYDKQFPSYTEVLALLKSDQRINANWLFLGIDDMFKEITSQKESERVNALVDTITHLQFAISAKSETISALNERIKQLESQINK